MASRSASHPQAVVARLPDERRAAAKPEAAVRREGPRRAGRRPVELPRVPRCLPQRARALACRRKGGVSAWHLLAPPLRVRTGGIVSGAGLTPTTYASPTRLDLV